MPPLGPAFSDEQVAAALTQIRRAWGHTGVAVDPLNVMEVRGLSKGRVKPWTDQELQPPAAAAAAGCDSPRPTAAPKSFNRRIGDQEDFLVFCS
jgi:hypothetical protein